MYNHTRWARLSALVVGAALPIASVALAAPLDPFRSGPTRDFAAPEGQRFAGDGQVVEQSGDATYAIPIEVPPGRLGMQPDLELSYSSSGALRGGLAVGWSLDLAVIERDPDFVVETRYRVGDQRLVLDTSDPTGGEVYRTEVDTSFARYKKTPQGWTVLTADGHTASYNLREQSRWRITEERDASGNTVRYFYLLSAANGAVEYYPSSIDYTANDAAGLLPHARVEFVYAPLELCGGAPIGASVDRHFGTPRLSGSRRLIEIKSTVRDTASSAWRNARSVRLGYDANHLECSAASAAMRYLTTVDVTGYTTNGTATTQPTIRFAYGTAMRALDRTITVTGAPREWGNGDGAKSGFMDIDGDGRNDFVEMLTQERCRLSVRRGLPDGQFAAAPYLVDMPSVSWASPGQPDAPTERCTLGGQVTLRYEDGPVPTGTPCHFEGVRVNYHFVDYNGDGRVDLLTSLSGWLKDVNGDFSIPGAHEAQNTQGSGSCPSGTSPTGVIETGPEGQQIIHCGCPSGSHYISGWGCVENTVESCPPGTVRNLLGGCSSGEPGGGGGGVGPDEPEPTCRAARDAFDSPNDREFTWRLHTNRSVDGDAQARTFAPVAEASTITAPKPLPVTAMTLDVEPVASAPGVPVLVDMDGDDRLDLVSLYRGSGGEGSRIGRDPLWVWRGQADGTFAVPVQWTFPSPFNLEFDSMGQLTGRGVIPALFDSVTRTAVFDVNQDRLPDLVFSANHALYVSYNHAGQGATAGPPAIGGAFSAPVELKNQLGLAFDSPVEQARSEATSVWEATGNVADGVRADTRRLLDVDGDGAADLVYLAQPTTGVRGLSTGRSVFRAPGNGTMLLPLYTVSTPWEALESLVSANRGTWSRVNDFVDLTGDGLPDAVFWQADRIGTAYIHTDVSPETARLLTSISNGHGGTTRFEYAFDNDASVVDLETRVSRAHRVVKRVTVEPGFGQPAISTTYQYKGPVTAPAGPGRTPSFLGFRQITIDKSGQSGAGSRTVATYDYNPMAKDWRGRIVSRTSLLSQSGSWIPTSIDLFSYASAPLAGGQASTTFPSRSEHRVCADGATESACLAQADALVTNHVYTPWPSATSPLLYTTDVTRTAAPGELERFSRNAFEVRYTATTTQVLPVVTDGGWMFDWSVPFYMPSSRVEVSYDARGLPTERRVFQSGSAVATTRFTYSNVGQPTRIKRPRQVAAGGNLEKVIGYDPFQIHVAVTTDEANRSVWTTTDVATGQPTQIQGPDVRSACASSMCFTWVYETQRFTRDGFGRVLSHERSFDPPPGQYGYTQRVDQYAAYYDAELPARTITWKLKDVSGTYVIDEAHVDGIGRTLDTIARRYVSGQPDAMTVFHYDGGGGLAAVESPDPRVNSGARVTTSFVRDGAGRVTEIQRPDGTRQQFSYRGLDTETTTLGDGERIRVLERKSLFGELAELHEYDNPQPDQTAITRYAYDAFGRVTTVTDSEGDQTTIGYDMTGQRTSVTRQGRTWSFDYDLDGNNIAVTEPVPAGMTVAAFKTSTTFDVLGRPTSTSYATRGLSAARLAELGIGAVSFTYAPYTDQVTTVTLPFGTIWNTYDASGNLAREYRTVRAPSMSSSVSQYVDRTYDALGNVLTTTWDDGVSIKHTTDSRGATATVAWRNAGMAAGTYETLATYARGVAGQAYARSGLGQQRDWRYDVNGRVVYDRIWRPGVAGSLSEQNVVYDAFGNVATQSAITAGLLEDSTYTYDAAQRLTQVVGANGYEARFTYSPAGNVRDAFVRGTSDDRDVHYVYGAVDPQAVDRMTDRLSGAVVGSFDYDRAGQMVRRQTSSGTTSMTWDASGILRETAAPGAVSRTFVGPGAERMIGVDATGITLWFDDSETLLGTNGALLRRYHHVSAGEPIARIENAATVELQYADTLQNLRLATSRTGAVNAAFTYGAFGEVLASIGSDKHERRFNGKDAERVAGLRSYGYRSYDPFTLRWVSADPIASVTPDQTTPQLANRYSFSANNPVRYLDPDGLEPDEDEFFTVKPEVKVQSNEHQVALAKGDGYALGFARWGWVLGSDPKLYAGAGLISTEAEGGPAYAGAEVLTVDAEVGKEGVKVSINGVTAKVGAKANVGDAGAVKGGLVVGVGGDLSLSKGKIGVKATILIGGELSFEPAVWDLVEVFDGMNMPKTDMTLSEDSSTRATFSPTEDPAPLPSPSPSPDPQRVRRRAKPEPVKPTKCIGLYVDSSPEYLPR